MDPCSQIVTTIMPLETNIINSIYVDSASTPELNNETCLTPDMKSHNISEANICSVSMIQCLGNKCGATNVQDVLHSGLNEAPLALRAVENNQNIESLNVLANSGSPSKAEYKNVSNTDNQVYESMLLMKDGQISTRDLISADVHSCCIPPEKELSITTMQNAIPPMVSTVSQCVYCNCAQSGSEREKTDEHGLNILADVISHSPVVPSTPTIGKQLADKVLPSTCIDVGNEHIMSGHQSKPIRKRLKFKFSTEVVDVWSLLENGEALLLTNGCQNTEATVELHFKKSDSGLQLSLEASDLEICSRKDELNTWQYVLKSLGDSTRICRDISDIVHLVRSRRTSDASVQVNPGALNAKPVAIKRRRSERNSKRSQLAQHQNISESLIAVQARGAGVEGTDIRQKSASNSGVDNHVDDVTRDVDAPKSPASPTPPLPSSPSSSSSSPSSSSQSAALASKQCKRNDDSSKTPEEVIPRSDGKSPSGSATDGMVWVAENRETTAGDNREASVDGEMGTSSTHRSRYSRRVVVSRTSVTNQKYKHSVKSNRSLNKELYELNRKVADSLNYEPPDSQSCAGKQTCVICGHVSQQRWLLLVHLRRFHVISPEKYYDLLRMPDAERDKQLDSLRRLQSDVIKRHAPKRAGTLPCHYCGEPQLGIRNMRRHLKLKHGRLDPAEVADKLRYYVTEYGKLIHRNRMIAIRKANLAKTEYPCRYCNAVLSMSCTRSRHELYTCPKNPNRRKRYHCNYCGTAYRSPEALDRHRAKHAQHDYKFVCDQCGKEYKTKPMLYEHRMNVHQGRDPKYSCTVCRKRFHYRDKLEKHLVTHSDKRDVMCDVCGKLFKTKADVQKHRKYVHERSYPHHCEKCGHGVAKLSYLKTHKCGRVRRSTGLGHRDPTPSSTSKSGTQSASVQAAEYTTMQASTSDGGGQQEKTISSGQYCMASVSCLRYEHHPQQQQQEGAGIVVSVDQFVRDQCTDMGYIGPAAPSALSVTQFIGPLAVATDVPVYSLSDSHGSVQQVDGTLLQQQQQQQTAQVVGGDNVADYKMLSYQQ